VTPVRPHLLALRIADQVIEYFQLPPSSTGERVRYPGEQILKIRKENLANGVPVDRSIWQQLQAT
jgi:3-dehydro-L-gulonate 2-dehydrogenase